MKILRTVITLMLIVFAARADEPTEVQKLQAAADWGDARAEYRLGTLYETGTDVPRDLRNAEFWYSRAEAHGDPDARKKRIAIQAELSHAISQRESSVSQGDESRIKQNPGSPAVTYVQLIREGSASDKESGRPVPLRAGDYFIFAGGKPTDMESLSKDKKALQALRTNDFTEYEKIDHSYIHSVITREGNSYIVNTSDLQFIGPASPNYASAAEIFNRQCAAAEKRRAQMQAEAKQEDRDEVQRQILEELRRKQ